jgi:tellurite resistance protein TehA-like permease
VLGSAAVNSSVVAVPVDAGSVVMGTAIESIALSRLGRATASDVVMWIAVAIWVGVAIALGARLLRDRDGIAAELGRPAALSAVAGTCVVGTRLTLAGWTGLGAALLACGAVLGLALLAAVLRRREWSGGGSVFLLAVAPESIAVLCAVVSRASGARWVALAGLVPLAAGVALYAVALASFDVRELVRGRGDQWVAGGALAISALAAAETGAALGWAWLRAASAVLAILAAAWGSLLVAGELRAPRLGADLRRWATVFPLGMYAVAGFAVGAQHHVHAVVAFARGWTWVSFAAWAVAFAVTIRRAAVP